MDDKRLGVMSLAKDEYIVETSTLVEVSFFCCVE